MFLPLLTHAPLPFLPLLALFNVIANHIVNHSRDFIPLTAGTPCNHSLPISLDEMIAIRYIVAV